MSDRRAQYEPVAWWFTRRRLGRELRNCCHVPEELPGRLLTLISELDGKPEVSVAADVTDPSTVGPGDLAADTRGQGMDLLSTSRNWAWHFQLGTPSSRSNSRFAFS